MTWRLGPAQLDVGHASYVEFTTPVCLRGLRPLAPASVSAAQGTDGLSLSWIRQTRGNGDSWDLTDVPLGEEAERYRLTIWDGSTLKRTVETSAPQFLYAAADLTADFGSLPATITLRIAQLSATLGAGTTLERTIHD